MVQQQQQNQQQGRRKKKLDERIRTLLERGVATNQRSLLILVGDHGKDQVPNLHQLLTKSRIQQRPSVLWCYKKELGFSTHRQKRIKKLKRDKARGLLGNNNGNSDADNFELFISGTDITWCYYKDSHRVLGQTMGMLVLQDFEALTPNLMARTMETVEGGGVVILLMRTVSSLKQLYTMTMDVHARYRTESASDIVPRFNERFLLSLSQCSNALVCDDELNILPSLCQQTLKTTLSETHHSNRIINKGDAGDVLVPETEQDVELTQLKDSLVDTPHVGVLIELTKTLDQAKAVLVFLETCSSHSDSTGGGGGGSKNAASLLSPYSNKTVAMTASRGRGKSAAMGLCLAGAISLGVSTIAVTAPTPENLVAVFDFVCRGLQALKYQEHLDYQITYDKNNGGGGRDAIKCIVSIQIHRNHHRQVIHYIAPHETDKFAVSEIVAIDEAAAIPLPIVQALMQSNNNRQQSNNNNRLMTFLSSTVNGYEGTGRALSLKLIKELRDSKGGRQAELNAAHAASDAIAGTRLKKGLTKVHDQRYKAAAAAAAGGGNESGGAAALQELELSVPIRYAQGDAVEAWLNKLLCLDCGSAAQLKLQGGAPAPGDCELYKVDRDALFSYHKLSEAFLQKLMGLYTSAHYKNTPNDLQMLSDAPQHQVFVLLSPSAEQDGDSLPDILAVVQVAMEGRISRKAVEAQLARGHRSAGDLIPWTISQQFGDSKFAQLSGARVVRIAVHPSVQSMGYGSRAVELLYRFYNNELIDLHGTTTTTGGTSDDSESSDDDDDDSSNDEHVKKGAKGAFKKQGIHGERVGPRKKLPPLLLQLTEVKAPRLDWIGTSFGLTLGLHKFWARAGMQLLYVRQTKNELTGEHSAIMVRALPKVSGVDDAWLHAFVSDTRRRFVSLLSGPFRNMELRLAIDVLERLRETVRSNNKGTSKSDLNKPMQAEELAFVLTQHDLKRLELYGRNLCDHHLITDLLPSVAKLYFNGRFGSGMNLSSVQSAILCGIGVQCKDVNALIRELSIPSNQVLAMFNKAIRKVSIALNNIDMEKEKEELYGGKKQVKAHEDVQKMRDVSLVTLDDDAARAARDSGVITNATTTTTTLPDDIAKDGDLMQYTVRGSDKQWDSALGGNETPSGTVRIQSVREKRKDLDMDDYLKEETQSSTKGKKPKSNKKSKRQRK